MRNIGIVFLLLAIVCITRIPFAAKCLYTLDSVNFALAMEDFNVSLHQPHPPGYPVYVALAKLLYTLIPDRNASLITLSILFSSGAAVLIFLLGRALWSTRLGLYAALVLVSSPLFWAFGSMPVSHAADAFGSLLVAYLLLRALKGSAVWLSVATVALGVMGGIRPDILLFLFPAWAFVLISMKRLKTALSQVLLMLLICMSWAIPLVQLSGGFSKYAEASRGLYAAAVAKRLFADKTPLYTLASSAWGLGAAALVLPCSLVRLRSWTRERGRPQLFLLLCCCPALVFCLGVFMVNPGYSLAYVPLLILLASQPLARLSSLTSISVVAVILLANTLLFTLGQPIPRGSGVARIGTLEISSFANFWALEYTRKGIAHSQGIKNQLTAIEKHFSPDTSILVVGDCRESSYSVVPRVVSYYLPDFRVVALSGEPERVDVLPEVTTLVWLVDEHDPRTQWKDAGEALGLAGPSGVYSSRIASTLRLGRCTFAKVHAGDSEEQAPLSPSVCRPPAGAH